MSYQINLSSEELIVLKILNREVKVDKLLRRYQCLHMLQRGMKRQDIAELLDVHIDTITDWVKLYQLVGLSGMGDLKYNGRRPSVLDEHKEEIKAHIRTNSVNTISELQSYLRNNLKLEIEHSWLSRYLKKNSIILKKTRLIPGKEKDEVIKKAL